MNNENELNNDNVSPYKASRNLNTAIGNPSVSISDTMNINIQNMATNSGDDSQVSFEGQVLNKNMVANQNINTVPQNNVVANQNINAVPQNNAVANQNINAVLQNNVVANQNINAVPQNNAVANQNNISNTKYTNQAAQSAQTVTRTYVTADNKPKKKKLTLSLGSEFKVALLIIVILLVFIFILPLITNLFKSY